MYNIAISVGLGLVVFALVSLALPWWGSILPALLVSGLAMFLLARRINEKLTPELAKLQPLLEARDVAGAQAHLRSIQATYGKWQLYLDSQLEAQLGMLDYLQMKWDEALPKLETGSWRNAHALICIGCIHYRKGDKDKAWESLGKAVDADSKEVMTHVVLAVLRAKSDQRDEALTAVAAGLQALPDNAVLKKLQHTIANKKKIDIKQLPQTWYQFFPEDMAKQMVVRGRKGPPPPGAPQVPQPRHGARSAPRR